MNRSLLTPFKAQKFLAGLRYPASKREIVERARQRGATDAVMHALVRLPERAYESPIVLSCEISRSGGAP